jgi:hypothetical protein
LLTGLDYDDVRSEAAYDDLENESILEEYPTPAITEVGIKPFCNLCTEEGNPQRRPFPSLRALQQHLDSVYHAPAVYHCPKVSFVKGLTSSDSTDVVLQESHERESREDRSHHRRSFESLQGLAAHVEANACKGGREMFKFSLDFLAMQFDRLGLKGMLRFGEIEEVN